MIWMSNVPYRYALSTSQHSSIRYSLPATENIIRRISCEAMKNIGVEDQSRCVLFDYLSSEASRFVDEFG